MLTPSEVDASKTVITMPELGGKAPATLE